MRNYLACLVVLGACAQQKDAVDDDFTTFAAMDQKSDAFSYRMKVVGSLDYGATSSSVKYTKTPRYRAFKFSGRANDLVDVWVKSTDGGDAVAWVLDNSFHVLATNDDASPDTVDAHVTVTLPANISNTHYIVFRDYNTATAHFTVDLTGGAPYDTSCATDDDCVAVPTGGCCPNGSDTAINVNATDDYAASVACTEPPHVCPLFVIHETRVAECNASSHKCEMIQPEDIRCGGFTMHAHQCPANYGCVLAVNMPDIPGHCVEQQ